MDIAEEEEKQTLIKVVEYVEETMSRELLCKFPDNSAFDFDYSQSSIWSPLVPRAYKPVSLMDMDITPRKKLSYGFGLNKSALKRVTTNIKKNITTTAFNINLNLMKNLKKKTKKKKGSDFSATPPSINRTSTSTKGWSKVLKAGSKHFKKKKKKDPTIQVKLSNYLRDGNF